MGSESVRREAFGKPWGGVLVLLLVLALCATPLVAKQDEENQDSEGYVNFNKEDHPLGEVLPNKALVYVLRPTSMGFAIKSFFFCDDEALGINRGSSYFFAHVDPGKHVFWSKSENVDALELEVEGGKTYYIQQKVQMGGFRARTKLEVLDEKKGEKALSKCKKHGAMTDKGREKAMEIARDHKKDTAEDLERRAEKEAKKNEKEANDKD